MNENAAPFPKAPHLVSLPQIGFFIGFKRAQECVKSPHPGKSTVLTCAKEPTCVHEARAADVYPHARTSAVLVRSRPFGYC
jgi:hypothetical protein